MVVFQIIIKGVGLSTIDDKLQSLQSIIHEQSQHILLQYLSQSDLDISRAINLYFHSSNVSAPSIQNEIASEHPIDDNHDLMANIPSLSPLSRVSPPMITNELESAAINSLESDQCSKSDLVPESNSSSSLSLDRCSNHNESVHSEYAFQCTLPFCV